MKVDWNSIKVLDFWKVIKWFSFSSSLDKPIEIVSGLKDKTCVENQSLKFEIELNKPDVLDKLVWLKDGKEIDLKSMPDNYELKAAGNKYTLTIKKAQLDDDGKYTVKIRDSDVSSSANLSVTGINF